jgi:NAD dependent epimerase/dehydratase family enzyme
MADGALLASARVRPERLLATGYHFQHPLLRPALDAML